MRHIRSVEVWDCYLVCDETGAILESWASLTLGQLSMILSIWDDRTLVMHRASLCFGPALAQEEVLL